MSGKKRAVKVGISAKVTKTTEERLQKEADENELTRSEYIARIIDEHVEQKEQIASLKEELREKNVQISRLQTSLEKEQENVSEAQKLQNNAENNIRQLSNKYQEVLEEQKQLVADVTADKNKTFIQRLFRREK